MADGCSNCRFWLVEEQADRPLRDERASSFGWCRRRPPMIIDHMARMAIAQPGFGGAHIDPEDVAGAVQVQTATLFPATFGSEWCGEHAALSSSEASA